MASIEALAKAMQEDLVDMGINPISENQWTKYDYDQFINEFDLIANLHTIRAARYTYPHGGQDEKKTVEVKSKIAAEALLKNYGGTFSGLEFGALKIKKG